MKRSLLLKLFLIGVLILEYVSCKSQAKYLITGDTSHAGVSHFEAYPTDTISSSLSLTVSKYLYIDLDRDGSNDLRIFNWFVDEGTRQNHGFGAESGNGNFVMFLLGNVQKFFERDTIFPMKWVSDSAAGFGGYSTGIPFPFPASIDTFYFSHWIPDSSGKPLEISWIQTEFEIYYSGIHPTFRMRILNFATGSISVGIDQSALFNLNFKFYPNPASETIFFQIANEESVQLEIFDAYGRMKIESKCTGDCTIDVSNLLPGLYFIKCTLNKSSVINKIIIY